MIYVIYRYTSPPQHEFDQAQLARRKAEAAKRKSDEMLARELLLKKECEAATREVRPTCNGPVTVV